MRRVAGEGGRRLKGRDSRNSVAEKRGRSVLKEAPPARRPIVHPCEQTRGLNAQEFRNSFVPLPLAFERSRGDGSRERRVRSADREEPFFFDRLLIMS